jgi:hypothetical protein
MFRDIRDPQLVRLLTRELTVYEIGCGQGLTLGTGTLVSWKAFHTSSSHQQLDTAVPNSNTVTKGEIGVNTPGAVGAMRGGVPR